ncbi:hypothetical protein O1L44_30450 [Streptomyces noursei]|uniref:hypothetical protein n=1 Tax=Streptomyces noursei TaxID=1971 RepID=UPI00081C64EA|nr:hypothetical protein SNOUR_00800 [Streptomyces noursei ATCC 11455]ANZ21852.1 hypothetical protein SNOUR_43150 [Streptomyces noursei ATCC 11455]MCZ0996462.1 hypothetical protein [Streptomyces noursei]
MPKYAPNKMPSAVKKRYFELLREGYKGAAAARVVGVSTSCGSNWFIEAGSMILPDTGTGQAAHGQCCPDAEPCGGIRAAR